MEEYKIKIIESIVVLIIFVFFKLITKNLIEKAALKFKYHKARIKIIKKLISLFLFSMAIVFLLTIWGVNQTELVLFISSILAVIGIALFAQWSLLSNITSTIIIFFSHPIKIGDRITILDKDYQIEGKISDIRVFFIIIKTPDGEYVSMPSSVFMQKMIKKNNT